MTALPSTFGQFCHQPVSILDKVTTPKQYGEYLKKTRKCKKRKK